jgi:hypothetical protein
VRQVVALLAAMLLLGCQGATSPGGPPSGYASHVCAAIAETGGPVRQALIGYQSAVSGRNSSLLVDSISRLKTATDVLRNELADLPAWPPGDALTADLTAVASHLGNMAELVRAALTTGVTARADQAAAELNSGYAALTAVPADAKAATSAGLHC